MEIYYDFHIHSCLSPCGNDEMIPKMIIDSAVAKELQAIALTDHNTTGNCAIFMNYAKEAGIIALPGMELQTSEDIHAICLFSALDDSENFGRYVNKHIPDIKNRIDIFGHQIRFNIDGSIEENPLMLINSTDISLYGLFELVDSFKGIAIPAHIDRGAFSLIGILGSLDDSYGFPTVEVFKDIKACGSLRFIQNSDAHNLDSFFESPYHKMEVEKITAEDIIKKLKYLIIIFNN